MQTEIQIDPLQQRKGRMIFLMMAIFFIIPILVVVLMYKFDWKPTGQSMGELISPPKLIDRSLTQQDSKGHAVHPFSNEKWSMVFVADQCEKLCMAKLQDMRQIHVSTYKDMLRVQRVLITKQSTVEDVLANYPDMLVINQPSDDVDRLIGQFRQDNLARHAIYLVDPLGHIMMRYPEEAPANHIRKDLTRLLKFSWAG